MSTLNLNHPMESATGIISRPPPPKAGAKMKLRLILPAVVCVFLLGAGGGFLWMKCASELMVRIPGSKWQCLAVVAALPFMWLLAVGMHEFGHVVGGWMGGGRFLLWQAGPFMVRRTPSGIRANWTRRPNSYGGLTACRSLEPSRFTPHRAAIMIVAGPAASFLLTVGALWLSGLLADWDHPFSVLRAVGQNLAILTAMMSFLIFLVTAAPIETGGFRSDGRRVFELLRGGVRSEPEAALPVLSSASMIPVISPLAAAVLEQTLKTAQPA